MFGFLGGAKFLTSKPFIGGMVGLVILASVFFGYKHYTGLLDRVDVLSAERTVLKTGLDIERSTVQSLLGNIASWEASQAELMATIDEMQENSNEAEAENQRLQELFAELSFEDLSVADADSVANVISDQLWISIGAATDPSRYDQPGEPSGEAGPPEAGASTDPPSGVEGS